MKNGNYRPYENAGPKLKKAYELLHGKTKYVFSRTVESDDSKAIFINSSIKKRVEDIKHRPDKNIWP